MTLPTIAHQIAKCLVT